MRLVLASILLALAACSDPPRPGGAINNNRDAAISAGDAAANDGDAAESDNGIVEADTGATEDDSGTTNDDAGGSDDSGVPPDDDAGVPADDAGPTDSAAGDSGLSAECDELLACCNQVPAMLQAQCVSAANANDTAQCTMFLGLAHQFGVCLGSGSDAGPRDAGPLGPWCTDYLACCPSLGPLQMNCETSAMNGDEMICMQSLAGLQQAGYCLSADASVPD